MQTFLPYEDFRASARVLDRQRLGKQRVEAKRSCKPSSDPVSRRAGEGIPQLECGEATKPHWRSTARSSH